MARSDAEFTLPTLVFGMVEVRRLQHELDRLDEYLRQMALRKDVTFEMPRVSRMLDALAAENHCDLLKGTERTLLIGFLKRIAASAPSIHMSFAADPSASFIAKIVGWMRANVHPLVLLQIGLQPTIAAGCVVRTNNKVFDLSLRQRFNAQHSLLTNALQGDKLK